MAARRNHTTTSSYRAIVGLTKRSPVIQNANTFTRQHQITRHMQISHDVNNNTSHVTCFRIITREASISLFRIAITFTNVIHVVIYPCMPSEIDPPDVYVYFAPYSVHISISQGQIVSLLLIQ